MTIICMVSLLCLLFLPHPILFQMPFFLYTLPLLPLQPPPCLILSSTQLQLGKRGAGHLETLHSCHSANWLREGTPEFCPHCVASDHSPWMILPLKASNLEKAFPVRPCSWFWSPEELSDDRSPALYHNGDVDMAWIDMWLGCNIISRLQ